MKNTFFKLFANCIPVDGASRSTICDLQRGEIHIIPNDLYLILQELEIKSIEKIKEIYGEDNIFVICEYIDFLIEKELGFICDEDEVELFPKLDIHFEAHSEVMNAIIDVDQYEQPFEKIIAELSYLRCSYLEIRCFSIVSMNFLNNIMKLLEGSPIKGVIFFVMYSPQLTEQEIATFCGNYLRVKSVTVHSTPFLYISSCNSIDNKNIIFISEIIKDERHCGFINPKYFSINIETFSESQKHNTCLNNKLSIDKNGYIRNCPASKNNFGHIESNFLIDVIRNSVFTSSWHINKNEIDICKICEFRHVCTDCRALIKDENNFLSKPINCTYDPYKAIWS